jgi:radical SAM-linked protein
LSSKKLKYKGHDERMSFLEAVFARGDENLSRLIEEAWGHGCRLDGWTEHFNFPAWLDAMDRTGIDGAAYSERSFGRDERLPWDTVDIGVSKDFLYREYERALAEEKTPGCREACSACGLKCRTGEAESQGISTRRRGDAETRGTEDAETRRHGDTGTQRDVDVVSPCHRVTASPRPKIKVRVQFAKLGRLRYLSHLELATAVLRGLRRAGVCFDFSKGFHPAPRVAFGPSLSVGIAGEREYFDMEVFSPFSIEFYRDEINRHMPEEIAIGKMAVIPFNGPSLSNFITRYEYVIRGIRTDDLRDKRADAFMGQSGLAAGCRERPRLCVLRDGKEVDISPCIEEVSLEDPKGPEFSFGQDIRLILRDQDPIKARIGETAEALFGSSFRDMDITRTAYYGWENAWIEPL